MNYRSHPPLPNYQPYRHHSIHPNRGGGFLLPFLTGVAITAPLWIGGFNNQPYPYPYPYPLPTPYPYPVRPPYPQRPPYPYPPRPPYPYQPYPYY